MLTTLFILTIFLFLLSISLLYVVVRLINLSIFFFKRSFTIAKADRERIEETQNFVDFLINDKGFQGLVDSDLVDGKYPGREALIRNLETYLKKIESIDELSVDEITVKKTNFLKFFIFKNIQVMTDDKLQEIIVRIFNIPNI